MDEVTRKIWRMVMLVLASVLILFEVWRLSLSLGVLVIHEVHPLSEFGLINIGLATVSAARVAVLCAFFMKWRWSLWLVVLLYAITYIPNGIANSSAVNGPYVLQILVPFILLAVLLEKRYLMPWSPPAIGSAKSPSDAK